MEKIVVEVGFLLDSELSYYDKLIKEHNGINTFSCKTHDIYWTKENLDGLSENQMKNNCIRFRKTNGICGEHFNGDTSSRGVFQNYNLYDDNSNNSFECLIDDLQEYEIKFEKNGFRKVFDTFKYDYQYMIGNMKSRIQLQDIDKIGLVLYYDNPDYYHLPLEKQRKALIDELNSYGFDFKDDELGIDKLRTLYYKEKKFSLNQNG